MADDLTLLLRIVCVWWMARYCVNRLWTPVAFRRTEVKESCDTVERSPTQVSLIRYFAAMMLVAVATSVAAFNGHGHDSFYQFSAMTVVLQCIDFSITAFAKGRWRTVFKALIVSLLLYITASYCHWNTGDAPLDRLLKSVLKIVQERRIWSVVLGYFVAVFPAGDLIGIFMKRWSDLMTGEQGLPDAGKWIGRLERFLTISLVLAGQPAGIAVLLTVKGALRFGEIQFDSRADSPTTSAEQRKLVEYILVGSLMSYTVALVTAWILTATGTTTT